MPGPWKPDMSLHSKIIDFSSKVNTDNYVRAGWELIETRSELIGNAEAVLIYRVGWPRNAGEPVCPPVIDEKPDTSSPPSSYSAN